MTEIMITLNKIAAHEPCADGWDAILLRTDLYAPETRRPAAKESLTTAAPAAVPDGYVLVPKEPTPEMLRAGYESNDRHGMESVRDVWEAMLAAAQKGE